MNLKKSIFSYIVWAVFVPFCCLSITYVMEDTGIRGTFDLPMAGMVGGICAYLLFALAVFFALRTICAEIGRHIPNTQKTEAVLSVILPVIVLVGIVVYLVLYLVYHTPLALEENRFYNQALVSDGRGVSFAVHGASWLYTCLLHVMLLVFGNTPFAGVVLQIVLFFICLLLLYIGMQAFAGTIPAVFSMAEFGFLPVSLRHVFSLTPELFYLALYLLGFSLLGLLYRKFRERRILSPSQHMEGKGGLLNVLPAIFALLLGIYIGFLVYLDIYSISLYLFPAVLFSVGKGRIKRAAASYFALLFGGIGGFSLSVTAVCQMEKMAVAAYLQELYASYVSEMKFEVELSRLIPFSPDVTTGGSILLISFAFSVIPAFFLWKKSQCSAFIINLFLVCGLSVFSVFLLNAQMITALAWIMLAGFGVYGMVRPGEEPDEEAVRESGEDTGNAEGIGGPQKRTGKKKTEWKEQTMPESIEIEEKTVPERSKNMVQTEEKKRTSPEAAIEKTEQEKPAPGEPLHNPLPVPKKKSRPQADFGYQVAEEKMRFDLDVSDEDDFDW